MNDPQRPAWPGPSPYADAPYPGPSPRADAPRHARRSPHAGPSPYPGPGRDPAPPAAEPPPGLLTLGAATVWRLAIAGAAATFAADGKDETMSSESLSYLSNVGVAIGFAALAAYPVLVGARRHEPRSGWLRGALTVMMVLVGAVFMVGMGGEPDGPHAVTPALVLADWLFVGRNQARTRAWEPVTWLAFPIAYLVYHRSEDLGLYEDILGDDAFATMVPAMLAGTVVVAYVLFGAARLRCSLTRPRE